MAKLTLDPNPTFDYPVSIPRPGLDPVAVRFTFKHRGRRDVLEWIKSLDGKDDVDIVMDMVTGWELDDAFSRENVAALCDNYAGAGMAIYDTYLRELRGAREKN